MALFGVFAISALVLVTIGADVYQHTVSDMSTNYETRVSVAYITEKIRQNDTLTPTFVGASITTLSGQPTLMLPQTVDDETYCTYLYFYDGYLKELFMKKDSSLGGSMLEAGINIMPLSALSMESVSDNLLSFQMTTTDGKEHQIYVTTHCKSQ